MNRLGYSLLVLLASAGLLRVETAPQVAAGTSAGKAAICRDGWIDLNKNGARDSYENPAVDLERRLDDLLAEMTLDEKTCQLATVYGFNRVLKDQVPTPQWKNEVWKDGIANIDEHCNGVHGDGNGCAVPPSRHAEDNRQHERPNRPARSRCQQNARSWTLPAHAAARRRRAAL